MSRQPIFNVPGGVTIAIALMALVHVGLAMLPEEQSLIAKLILSFRPTRFTGEIGLPFHEPPGGIVWSLITHQFVHGDVTHLIMNSAWLLAFGGALAKRIGNWRFALLGLASGIAGALTFLAFRYNDPLPMVGASGAVSGLMGAAFRFFFNDENYGGSGSLRVDPGSVPRMSLRETFTNRNVLFVIAIWVVLNFITAAAAHLITSGAGIAWEAHLGGFLFGILAFGLFDPPRRPEPDWMSEPMGRTLH